MLVNWGVTRGLVAVAQSRVATQAFPIGLDRCKTPWEERCFLTIAWAGKMFGLSNIQGLCVVFAVLRVVADGLHSKVFAAFEHVFAVGTRGSRTQPGCRELVNGRPDAVHSVQSCPK